MSRPYLPALAALSAIPCACAVLEVAAPPRARPGDVVDELHGTRVADPFRWLEDSRSSEVGAWVEAQDSYAREWVARAPEHAARRERIRAASLPERYLAPLERGGRYFVARVDAAVTRTTWLVREGWNGAERVLIDGEALIRAGEVCERTAWPSPDGSKLAFTQGTIGSSWRTLRVLDVDSGRLLSERIPGFVVGASALAWHPSGDGFFLARFEPPRSEADTAPFAGQRVEYHALGASTQHELVVPPVGTGVFLALAASDDGRYLVLTLRDSGRGCDEVRAARLGVPLGPWLTLVPADRGRFTFVGSRADELWFQTTFEAENGRVVAIRADDPAAQAREFVPECELAMDTWTTNGVRALGEGLIATYREQARLLPRQFDASGRRVRDLELPYLGSVWSGWVGTQGSSEAFYLLSGFVDPGTVYRLDLESGRSEAVLEPRLPYDPRAFVTRQVSWSGPAGERIPMYLAHHVRSPPDGERPVMLYGYAFAGWSAAPWFRPHMAEWLESGGTFALPALRGGGEFGAAWHASGVRRERQNAIDDFVACARWLVGTGLARPDRLAAETNSAGASAVAAALLQAPDVFGAGILAFPLLDVLRYDRFTGGAAWRSELGTVEDPDDFRALLAYAPNLAVRPGVAYPALFVAPGSLDQVTPPCHAYKFVATLQAAGAPRPALLRVAHGAGHAYGKDLASSIESFADQLSFLARAFGE